MRIGVPEIQNLLINPVLHSFLLENKAFGHPQQSPPRGAIGIGQLGRLRSRAGPIAPRGGAA